MSAATAARGPGVSTMDGAPLVAGWRSRAAKGAVPIWPAPMFSCRSRWDPQPSLESLAWIRRSRPRQRGVPACGVAGHGPALHVIDDLFGYH
jgi:hypothetical protein